MKKLAVMAAMGLLAMPVPVSAENAGLEAWRARQADEAGTPDAKPARPGLLKRLFGSGDPEPAEEPAAQRARTPTKAPAKARKRQHSPQSKVSAEARWWEKTGNPAVHGFRDCASVHAAASPVTGKPGADYISEAIVGPCRNEFVTMTDVLAGRFGKAGFRKLSRELVDTTFIPAIRTALAEAEAMKPAPDALERALKRNKLAMFNCFNGRADAFATATSASVEDAADAVLNTCRQDADRYFSSLFASYPLPPEQREAKKHAALDETYRQAIERRIVIQRGRTADASASGARITVIKGAAGSAE